jgi:hypothetical protein
MFMFDEAEQLIKDHEKVHSPCPVMYSKYSIIQEKKDQRFPCLFISVILLSGARNHRRTLLSQRIYDQMKLLFPDHKPALIVASILVSNTYRSVGEDEQAQYVRNNRFEQIGKRVKAGVSWTEVNGELVVNCSRKGFSSGNMCSSTFEGIHRS